MSQADPVKGRAREEASVWFARLKRRQVSLAELETFRTWREDPANRAAYEDVDRTWRRAGGLKGETEINRALNEALARGAVHRGRRERRGAWLAGAGVASIACLAVVAGTWLYLQARPTYSTKIGEQRLVRLADGSSVRLDTDSRIDVAFSPGARNVRLEQGQAFFDVAHDAGRPFLVAAGPVTVRAVGTRFDVRAYGPQATVTLVEGVVEVRRQGAAPQIWTLRPGQQVATSAAAAPRAVNVEAATSWTSGRVVFQGIALGAAVEEINRYSLHKIVLRAPGAAATPVTGSFETGDTDAFVSAVSDLNGLRSVRQPDGDIVLDAAPPPPH
jgi:transmembrane sensor